MHSVAELTKNLSDTAAFVKRSFAYAQDDSVGNSLRQHCLKEEGKKAPFLVEQIHAYTLEKIFVVYYKVTDK